MICTSAFSTGNDYASVRLVIHMKMPREMTELIQAQGRGGRDGLPARCYILASATTTKIAIGRDEEDHKGLWYAKDYIYGHGLDRCLRYGATLYVDGAGTKCEDDPRNERCCVCKEPRSKTKWPSSRLSVMKTLPDPPKQTTSLKRPIEKVSTENGDQFFEAYEGAKKLRTNRLEGELAEVERMKKALNKIKDKGCALCQITGNAKARDGHVLRTCPSFATIGVTCNAYMSWKKAIRYHHHKGICWKCHVPTCGDELHGVLVSGEANCDWPDTVIPLAIGIFRDDKTREAAEKMFKVDWKKQPAEFAKWLSKRPEPERHSSAMDLLLWWVDECMKTTENKSSSSYSCA